MNVMKKVDEYDEKSEWMWQKTNECDEKSEWMWQKSEWMWQKSEWMWQNKWMNVIKKVNECD